MTTRGFNIKTRNFIRNRCILILQGNQIRTINHILVITGSALVLNLFHFVQIKFHPPRRRNLPHMEKSQQRRQITLIQIQRITLIPESLLATIPKPVFPIPERLGAIKRSQIGKPNIHEFTGSPSRESIQRCPVNQSNGYNRLRRTLVTAFQ